MRLCPNVVIDSDLCNNDQDGGGGYDSDSEAHHQLEAREQQCVVGADAEGGDREKDLELPGANSNQ